MRNINKVLALGLVLTVLIVSALVAYVNSDVVIIDNVQRITELYSSEPLHSDTYFETEQASVEEPMFRVPSETPSGVRYNHTLSAGTYRFEI